MNVTSSPVISKRAENTVGEKTQQTITIDRVVLLEHRKQQNVRLFLNSVSMRGSIQVVTINFTNIIALSYRKQ